MVIALEATKRVVLLNLIRNVSVVADFLPPLWVLSRWPVLPTTLLQSKLIAKITGGKNFWNLLQTCYTISRGVFKFNRMIPYLESLTSHLWTDPLWSRLLKNHNSRLMSSQRWWWVRWTVNKMRYSRNPHKTNSVKQRNITASTTVNPIQWVSTRQKQNHTKRQVLTRKWWIFQLHLLNSKKEMSAFWPDLHNFYIFY